MNIRRAQEISEASEIKNVTYNGTPVIIQHVEEQSGMARIYPTNQPEAEKTVPVNQLIEE